MTAQVRGVAGHHDHVARADGDYLLAAWADVGLARLGGVDPPDVEPERFAGRGQVGDLLELFQLERRTLGLLAPPTTSWGRPGHARQVTHSHPLLAGPGQPARPQQSLAPVNVPFARGRQPASPQVRSQTFQGVPHVGHGLFSDARRCGRSSRFG